MNMDYMTKGLAHKQLVCGTSGMSVNYVLGGDFYTRQAR